jgi:cell division protein FtsL
MSLPQLALPRPQQEPQRRPRPSGRPAPQKKRPSFGRLAFGGLIWVAVMGSCFLLVSRQAEIHREMRMITDLQMEIKTLDQQNQEAASRLVQSESVAAVDAWAKGHGMVRPSTVKPLQGDPSAVASRPATGDTVAAAESTGGIVGAAKSLWQALFAPLSAKAR